MLLATAAYNFATSELRKVLRGLQFFFTFSLPNVLFATAACNVATSDLRKVPRGLQFFNIFTSCFSPQRRAIFREQNFKKCSGHRQFLSIFTSKCAFHNSGVQFFDSRTSKSAPRSLVFEHFHFQMCFSPQRRAIFPQQNFKKCSETVSF